MNEQLYAHLKTMDLDNIYDNSYESVQELQRILGVKDDGFLGDRSMKALQRAIGTKADGIWGKNSLGSAKKFLEQNKPEISISSKIRRLAPAEKSESTFVKLPIFSFTRDDSKDESGHLIKTPYSDSEDESSQSHDYFYNLDGSISAPEAIAGVKKDKINMKIGIPLLNGLAPKDYMTLAREGKATAGEIGDERLQTVTNYLTEDLGVDFNYNKANFVGKEKRKNLLNLNLDSLKTVFDKQYFEETGRTGKVMYSITPAPLRPVTALEPENTSWPEFNYRDKNTTWGMPLIDNAEDYRYTHKLADYLRYSPARVEIKSILNKGKDTPEQTHLTDKDRDAWHKELHTEGIQHAELISQLNKARADQENALTLEAKREAEQREMDLSRRIALASNAASFSHKGQIIQSFPQEYKDVVNKVEAQGYMTPEDREALQSWYDRLGINPHYTTMSPSEKYILDHTHGAGYSYEDMYDNDRQTTGQITQKFRDAASGKFTHRGNYPEFTLRGDRQGLHRQTTQRGEPLTEWIYNEAPTDALNNPLNKPFFEISPVLAHDYSTGEKRVALGTTGNYIYGDHQKNIPLFVSSRALEGNKWLHRDLSDFRKWPKSEQLEMAAFLEKAGFNVKKAALVEGAKSYLTNQGLKGIMQYDLNAAQLYMQQIQQGARDYLNPTPEQLSGERSISRGVLRQDSGESSNAFGDASTRRIQYVDGKKWVINQDLWDYEAPGLGKMFGGFWMTNARPISEEEDQQIRSNLDKYNKENPEATNKDKEDYETSRLAKLFGGIPWLENARSILQQIKSS